MKSKSSVELEHIPLQGGRKMENRSYYVESIKDDKKTLQMLADEMHVTVQTVKMRIRRCYERKAWAEKLINTALENEKQLEHSDNKDKQNIVLVDTSMLLNYPEVLKTESARMYVPKFCWNTALRIVQGEKKTNPTLARQYESTMAEFEIEELFFQELPYIPNVPQNAKAHSVMFLKYLLKMREQNPQTKVSVLTCSREIRHIADLNGISL